MSTERKRPVITIYCTGGAGTNLGYLLSESKELGEARDIYCDFKIRYIDTSDRNFIGKDIDIEAETFVFPAKGAGQVPGSVYSLIMATYMDVFKKFPPTDINIIITGLSGGTGSVLGAVLGRHLVDSGRPTIIQAIGAIDTKKHAENTRDAIATLQGVSKSIKKPVILNYHENIPGSTEDSINKRVIFNTITTAILLSGVVERIDDSDIANWLNYTRITQQPPSLTGFNVVIGNDPMTDYVRPFAALSIHRNESIPPRDDQLDFKKVGYLQSLPGNADSIHFYLDKPSIGKIFESLKLQVESLTEVSKDRIMDFDFGDGADENGFVIS